jgi:hypothetical protein
MERVYLCSECPAGTTPLVFVLQLTGFLRRIRTGFVLLCHTHQETDKVVQLNGTEPGSIVRRHQRTRMSCQPYDVGIERPTPLLTIPIKSN